MTSGRSYQVRAVFLYERDEAQPSPTSFAANRTRAAAHAGA